MLSFTAHTIGGGASGFGALAPVRQRFVNRDDFAFCGGAHIKFPVAYHGQIVPVAAEPGVQVAAVDHADGYGAVGAV